MKAEYIETQLKYMVIAKKERNYTVKSLEIGMYVKRENFISGYVNGEIVAPWCYDGSCDKEFFEYWVEKALIPVLEEGMVVIMDNASFHKSEKVKKMIENAKCRLLFLPPYSPELNPIEKFWANLKKLVTKIAHKYKNFRDAINYAFRYYMIPN